MESETDMFVIQLMKIEGVEWILKALRQTDCIASQQLADGIEAKLLYIDPEGNAHVMQQPASPSAEKKPSLRVVN